MDLAGKVCVVTGAAGGIGSACARAFAEAGARAVVVSDLDAAGAEAVAADIRGQGGQAVAPCRVQAIAADVGTEAGNLELIARAERELGPIDLFHANAGVAVGEGVAAADAVWDLVWRVNVMAHVWVARAMVPRWITRGGGYLITTASMAGILTSLGDGPYAATKHAAVGFAEWLAITHGAEGVHVSCLCPGAINTKMLRGALESAAQASTVIGGGAVMEPVEVARLVVQAVREERFLVFTHPEMNEFVQRKANDPERWLRGMQRLWERGRKLVGG
jgi:NAD(P)-dependent dehydrogenase (short-subunit alcohol dehydrogenase family)